MSEPIISIRNLGKKFNLGQTSTHDTLRDHLASFANRLFGKKKQNTKEGDFWALKDVSFDVRPGEVLGIIGRNGAGKSTLLKLLSQITEPSEGEIRLKGRIASLLEVGTGFHPELSGRENIFLNGAILGMTKAEIKSKFDEIVEFAEVEKFLNTPVKHYSSGMYVRLAFAVAAHLESEILVVDEVLAVGDIQFQKRCMGKMSDVAKSGRTILFVSHNLAAVQKLCTRGILLEQGRLKYDGTPHECLTRYQQGGAETHGEFAGYTVSRSVLEKQLPTAPIVITGVEMFDLEQNPLRTLNTNGGFTLRVHYRCEGEFARGAVAFMVKVRTHLGQEILRLSNMPISGFPIDELGLTGHLDLAIQKLPLVGGRYSIDLKVFRPAVETVLKLTDVVTFEVSLTDVYNSGVGMDQSRGLFVAEHVWSHKILEGKSKQP